MLGEFESFLEQERGLSPTTVHIRHKHILRFLTWFEQEGHQFSEITIQDVERFLALPRKRPWSRVTVAGYVASLRAFFRYAEARKWCVSKIGEAISAPRLYRLEGLPAGPSWTQVKQLITGISNEKRSDIRNRAIIMMLAVYGFRSSVVCRLQLTDLD